MQLDDQREEARQSQPAMPSADRLVAWVGTVLTVLSFLWTVLGADGNRARAIGGAVGLLSLIATVYIVRRTSPPSYVATSRALNKVARTTTEMASQYLETYPRDPRYDVMTSEGSVATTAILQTVATGRHVILTGTSGSGKTHALMEVVSDDGRLLVDDVPTPYVFVAASQLGPPGGRSIAQLINVAAYTYKVRRKTISHLIHQGRLGLAVDGCDVWTDDEAARWFQTVRHAQTASEGPPVVFARQLWQLTDSEVVEVKLAPLSDQEVANYLHLRATGAARLQLAAQPDTLQSLVARTSLHSPLGLRTWEQVSHATDQVDPEIEFNRAYVDWLLRRTGEAAPDDSLYMDAKWLAAAIEAQGPGLTTVSEASINVSWLQTDGARKSYRRYAGLTSRIVSLSIVFFAVIACSFVSKVLVNVTLRQYVPSRQVAIISWPFPISFWLFAVGVGLALSAMSSLPRPDDQSGLAGRQPILGLTAGALFCVAIIACQTPYSFDGEKALYFTVAAVSWLLIWMETRGRLRTTRIVANAPGQVYWRRSAARALLVAIFAGAGLAAVAGFFDLDLDLQSRLSTAAWYALGGAIVGIIVAGMFLAGLSIVDDVVPALVLRAARSAHEISRPLNVLVHDLLGRGVLARTGSRQIISFAHQSFVQALAEGAHDIQRARASEIYRQAHLVRDLVVLLLVASIAGGLNLWTDVGSSSQLDVTQAWVLVRRGQPDEVVRRFREKAKVDFDLSVPVLVAMTAAEEWQYIVDDYGPRASNDGESWARAKVVYALNRLEKFGDVVELAGESYGMSTDTAREDAFALNNLRRPADVVRLFKSRSGDDFGLDLQLAYALNSLGSYGDLAALAHGHFFSAQSADVQSFAEMVSSAMEREKDWRSLAYRMRPTASWSPSLAFRVVYALNNLGEWDAAAATAASVDYSTPDLDRE